MLVLSRRVNETILFPGLGITIHVLRMQGNTVRLGIEAPAAAQVLRSELVPAFAPDMKAVQPTGDSPQVPGTGHIYQEWRREIG
jgi:carbon storage regulator CsrA